MKKISKNHIRARTKLGMNLHRVIQALKKIRNRQERRKNKQIERFIYECEC